MLGPLGPTGHGTAANGHLVYPAHSDHTVGRHPLYGQPQSPPAMTSAPLRNMAVGVWILGHHTLPVPNLQQTQAPQPTHDQDLQTSASCHIQVERGRALSLVMTGNLQLTGQSGHPWIVKYQHIPDRLHGSPLTLNQQFKENQKFKTRRNPVRASASRKRKKTRITDIWYPEELSPWTRPRRGKGNHAVSNKIRNQFQGQKWKGTPKKYTDGNETNLNWQILRCRSTQMNLENMQERVEPVPLEEEANSLVQVSLKSTLVHREVLVGKVHIRVKRMNNRHPLHHPG